MYIWVVLATFLAILASYTLPPRDDMRKLTVEPLAEVYIAKIFTQHRAAEGYAHHHSPPYKPEIRYKHGELGAAELNPYFPPGHQYYGDFITKIYCMDELGKTLGSTATNDDCKVQKNKKVVVTFAPIPLRWMNHTEDSMRPNTDFMNAMRNTVDSGTSFGYIEGIDDTSSELNISNSPIRLVDRDNSEDVYVYKAIVEDSDFNEFCDVENDQICLVYQTHI